MELQQETQQEEMKRPVGLGFEYELNYAPNDLFQGLDVEEFTHANAVKYLLSKDGA